MLLNRHQYFHRDSDRLLTVNVDIFALLWKRLPTSLYPGHFPCHLWNKKNRSGNEHLQLQRWGWIQRKMVKSSHRFTISWMDCNHGATVPSGQFTPHKAPLSGISVHKIATKYLYGNSLVCCRLHTLQRKDDQYQMCTRNIIYINNTLKKVKWSRYRPSVAQRVGRCIALLLHDRGTWRGWVVSSTHRSHFTPGRDPVPILQEAGWAPGPVCTSGKSRPHQDSIPDRPDRSSVYIPTKLPGPHM